MNAGFVDFQGRKVQEFLFHPSEREWLMAAAWSICEDYTDVPCKIVKELFVTQDLGENWEQIGEYVVQYQWLVLS